MTEAGKIRIPFRSPAALAAAIFLASCTATEIAGLAVAPKTLVDRAIEARSAEDIAKDNEIVLKANAAMADLGTIKASTTIYEQRLLVTGLFGDKALYDRFEQAIRAVPGVKKLYWHAVHVSEAAQAKRKDVLSWDEVLVIESKAAARLIGTAGVADVNFRVTADALGTLYLIGRARSQAEHAKALARVRDGDGVRKVVDYAVVRP